jgi:hypothetical protein
MLPSTLNYLAAGKASFLLSIFLFRFIIGGMETVGGGFKEKGTRVARTSAPGCHQTLKESHPDLFPPTAVVAGCGGRAQPSKAAGMLDAPLDGF